MHQKVYIASMMMMVLVIYHDHKTKNTGGATAMSTSLGAHVSDAARDKLKLYQDVNEFKNVSDSLEDILIKMPEPVPKKKRDEPDPNQTKLPGYDS